MGGESGWGEAVGCNQIRGGVRAVHVCRLRTSPGPFIPAQEPQRLQFTLCYSLHLPPPPPPHHLITVTSQVGGTIKRTHKKKIRKLSHPPPPLFRPLPLPLSRVSPILCGKSQGSSRHSSVCLLEWPAAEPCPSPSPSPRTAESIGRSASSRK